MGYLISKSTEGQEKHLCSKSNKEQEKQEALEELEEKTEDLGSSRSGEKKDEQEEQQNLGVGSESSDHGEDLRSTDQSTKKKGRGRPPSKTSTSRSDTTTDKSSTQHTKKSEKKSLKKREENTDGGEGDVEEHIAKQPTLVSRSRITQNSVDKVQAQLKKDTRSIK